MSKPEPKPIKVEDALRLIEMALEDEAKFPDLFAILPGRIGGLTVLHGWMNLARATMRPMLEYLGHDIRMYADGHDIDPDQWIYSSVAALQSHYDRVRPDWRTK